MRWPSSWWWGPSQKFVFANVPQRGPCRGCRPAQTTRKVRQTSHFWALRSNMVGEVAGRNGNATQFLRSERAYRAKWGRAKRLQAFGFVVCRRYLVGDPHRDKTWRCYFFLGYP